MSTINAKLHVIDGNGNTYDMHQTTSISDVDGLQTALNAKANASDVTSRLAGKVDKESGKGLSTNDFTTAEKNKLSGIEAQANKTVVDSALSSSSTNPVQNKIVNAALDTKASKNDVNTIKSTLEGIATPQMYGALGDGEHDDTAAIQRAVEENRYVYFPEGRYKITEPIKTFADITKAVSLSLNQNAEIFTTQSIECLFDFGGKDPDYEHKIGYKKFVEGGLFNCENTTYGLIFEQTIADYHVKTELINCKNGILLGRNENPTYSQDIYIDKCLIQGKGGFDKGVGVEINSHDDSISYSRIYGFVKSFHINGSGTQIDSVHDLKMKFVHQTSDPDFEAEFKETIFAKITSKGISTCISRSYSDTNYTFIDSDSALFKITDCMYYSYISTVPVDLFIIRHPYTKCVIRDNLIMLPTEATTSAIGIDLSNIGYTNYQRLLRDSFVIIQNNIVSNPHKLRIGDILNGYSDYIAPYIDGSEMWTGVWHLLGNFLVIREADNIVNVSFDNIEAKAGLRITKNGNEYQVAWDKSYDKNDNLKITFGVKVVKEVDGLVLCQLWAMLRGGVNPSTRSVKWNVKSAYNVYMFNPDISNNVINATDSSSSTVTFNTDECLYLNDCTAVTSTSKQDWTSSYSLPYKYTQLYEAPMIISVHWAQSNAVYLVYGGRATTITEDISGENTIEFSLTPPSASADGRIDITLSETGIVNVLYLA